MATSVIDNGNLWWFVGLASGVVTTATFPKTPPVSTTIPLVLLGPTLLSGGAAAGTYIGINQSGTADLINCQASGTTVFKVDSTGTVTSTGTSSLTTLTVTGLATFSRTGNNAVAITGAPVNTATLSLLRVGGAIAGGDVTASGGTYIGGNAPAAGAGSAADWVNLQANGTSKFKVDKNGNVTAGTYNGLTVSPAASTLAIAAAKSLTVSNILTFTGTDSTSFAFPSSSGTVVTATTALTRLLATPVTLVDGATVAVNAASGTVYDLAASGDRTLSNPTNSIDGYFFTVRHKAVGAGRTLTLDTKFKFGSDLTSLTQTASGKTDHIGFRYDLATDTWAVVAAVKGYNA